MGERRFGANIIGMKRAFGQSGWNRGIFRSRPRNELLRAAGFFIARD